MAGLEAGGCVDGIEGRGVQRRLGGQGGEVRIGLHVDKEVVVALGLQPGHPLADQSLEVALGVGGAGLELAGADLAGGGLSGLVERGGHQEDHGDLDQAEDHGQDRQADEAEFHGGGPALGAGEAGRETTKAGRRECTHGGLLNDTPPYRPVANQDLSAMNNR